MRGGVNEGWLGWANGSNPVRAARAPKRRKAPRSFGQRLPSRGGERRGSRPHRPEWREPPDPLQSRAATQVLERFRGGELTHSVQPFVSGRLDPCDVHCRRKADFTDESPWKARVARLPSTRVTDRRWQTPGGMVVRCRRGREVGPECLLPREVRCSRVCSCVVSNCRSGWAMSWSEKRLQRVPKGPQGA